MITKIQKQLPSSIVIREDEIASSIFEDDILFNISSDLSDDEIRNAFDNVFLEEIKSIYVNVDKLGAINLNHSYIRWAENFEAEFEEHRQQNCRLIYRYQDGYDYYRENPEWVMVGDFCNFIRRDALNRGSEITSKYEKLMMEDIDVFRGFLISEFNRIKPFRDVDETLNRVFEYNNMSVSVDGLDDDFRAVFDEVVGLYKDVFGENIELFSKL